MHLGRYSLTVALLLATAMIAAGETLPESEAFAAQREQRTQLRRRVIYNNDGCDIFPADADTPQGFLDQRMNAVLGSQVDSVFYCTGATTMFSHDAKVGEVYGKYPVDDDWAVSVDANIKALKAQGTDALKLAIDFCRKHGKEVFFTHRINDIHDSFTDWELSTWKREHPEYLLGSMEDMRKYDSAHTRYWWSSLNFELPQVRDYLIAIIEDVCQRYDIDGIEIDYFRAPMFFRPTLDLKPVTQAQVDILTGFQRRVRQVAYREGNRRGRPILVSARVPMTVSKCRFIGIDVKRWLADDLLDILATGGGYMPFTMPTRQLVELGHQYNTPVYPTISASGMKGRFRSVKSWRAAASNALHNGADGIVIFNVFPRAQGHPFFTQLGDPAKLRYANKVFAIDNRKMTLGCLAHAIEQDRVLPRPLPAQLVLPVGDDIAQAAQDRRIKRIALHLRCDPLPEGDTLAVQLNGKPAPPWNLDDSPYAAPGKISGAYLFDGNNVLSTGNAPGLQIEDRDFTLSLWVKTQQKAAWSGFLVFVDPNHDRGVKLYWHLGELIISLRRAGWNNWTIPGGDNVLDGQWHHYAATFDRDDMARVYLDGKLMSEHNISDKAGSLGANMTMQIGTGNVPFDGFIDDLRLYHRALTDDEIGRLATSPQQDGPDDAMGWWKFDDTNALTVSDSSGNNNHATPQAEGEGEWLIYKPDPASLRQGDNHLVIQLANDDGRRTGEDAAAPIHLKDIELHVDYK